MRAEPVAALVNWPAGQSRQEVEPGPGWYFEAGQEVQALGTTHDPSGLAQDNRHAMDAATPFESTSSKQYSEFSAPAAYVAQFP